MYERNQAVSYKEKQSVEFRQKFYALAVRLVYFIIKRFENQLIFQDRYLFLYIYTLFQNKA